MGMTGAGGECRARRTVAVPVTSAVDSLEHLVADEAIVPGNAGHYAALCERDVCAAALAAPPGPRCPECVAVHNADVADGPRHRRADRSGAWARLMGLLRRLHPARRASFQSVDVTSPSSEAIRSASPEKARR